MKQKNSKINITKHRIIKESENLQELDVASDFAGMLGAVKDTAKMYYATLKRMFKTTVFGCKATKAIAEGDFKKLDNLNAEFLRQDELEKRAQDQIIKAQPGNSDLEMFLGIANPSVLIFDRFLGLNKPEIYEKLKGDKGEKQRLARSKAAYYNLVSRIAEITNGAEIDLNEPRDVDNEKIKELTSSVVIAMKTQEFKKGVAFLGTFSSKENEELTQMFSIDISKEMYNILYLIHEENKHKYVIKQVNKDYSLYHQLERIVTNLRSQSVQSKFKSSLNKFSYKPMEKSASSQEQDKDEPEKPEEAESTEDTSSEKNENISYKTKTINIKKNVILESQKELNEIFGLFGKKDKGDVSSKQVKEVIKDLDEQQFDSSEELKKCESAMQLLRLNILTNSSLISFRKISAFLNIKRQTLQDAHDFVETSSESIKDFEDRIDSIDEITQFTNNIIFNYVKNFGDLLKQKPQEITNDGMEKEKKIYVDNIKKTNEEHKKAESESENPEYKKMMCYTKILNILDSKEEKITDLVLKDSAVRSKSKFDNAYKTLSDKINKSLDLSEQIKTLSNLFNIDIRTFSEIEKSKDLIDAYIKEIEKASDTFKNFIQERDTVEEKLNNSQEILNKAAESKESGEDSDSGELYKIDSNEFISTAAFNSKEDIDKFRTKMEEEK